MPRITTEESRRRYFLIDKMLGEEKTNKAVIIRMQKEQGIVVFPDFISRVKKWRKDGRPNLWPKLPPVAPKPVKGVGVPPGIKIDTIVLLGEAKAVLEQLTRRSRKAIGLTLFDQAKAVLQRIQQFVK